MDQGHHKACFNSTEFSAELHRKKNVFEISGCSRVKRESLEFSAMRNILSQTEISLSIEGRSGDQLKNGIVQLDLYCVAQK